MGLVVAGAMAMGGAASGDEAPWLKTDFLDFQMPQHWSCNDETPKTCRDSRPERRKDALASFAGKAATAKETLPNYFAYLNRPKTWAEEDGGTVTSRVVEATTLTIAGTQWVSVIHDDSELRGYRTRYLVSVKDGEVVVITFTARTETYSFFAGEIDRGLASAKIKNPGPKP